MSTKFIPTQDQIDYVEELAALGWPETKIAGELGINPTTFLHAKKNFKALADAVLNGRTYTDPYNRPTATGWYPTELDLLQVEELARGGLTLREVSVAMGLGAEMLERRCSDTPMIVEAFNRGESAAVQKVTNKLMVQIDKGNIAAIIFFLKARGKWNDRAGAVEPARNLEKDNNDDQQNKVGVYVAPKEVSQEAWNEKASALRAKRVKAKTGTEDADSPEA